MRTLCFALMSLVSTAVLAQPIRGIGGSAFGASGVSVGDAHLSLRAEPPSSALILRFGGGFHGRSALNGRSFFSRYLLDRTQRTYFGYELLIQELQPGEYLATFGTLGMTPLEMSLDSIPRIPANAPPTQSQFSSKEWTLQPLPVIPEPRVVHDGDTISIDIFVDATTREKLIDDVHIERNLRRTISFTPLNRTVPNVPSVSGDARDFSAADAELQLSQPLVTVNGAIQDSTGSGRVARGSLVWIYIPKRGRYILSLAPRADLDFKKAGEVRGGAITFTVGEDSITLENPSQIATGDAPYNLYVLRDAEWEPTAQAQKGQLAIGSVGVGELIALKRK